MAQHGNIVRSVGYGSKFATESEPVLCRALALRNMTANTILEAFLKKFALRLEDDVYMIRVCDGSDYVVLQFCPDRANVNFSLVCWVIIAILKKKLQNNNIMAHLEPCGSHGTALVKTRATNGTKISASANTLSRLLRQGNFSDELSDVVEKVVERTYRIKYEQRPQVFEDRAAQLLNTLFTSEDDAYLYVKDQNGQRRESRMFQNTKALMRIVQLCPILGNHLCHYCYVEDRFLRGRGAYNHHNLINSIMTRPI